MLRAIMAAAAAAGVAAAPASGQTATIKDPTAPIRNFDVPALGPVLTELGLSWRAASSRGAPYIAAKSGDLDFIVSPEACRSVGRRNCNGVKMIAIFVGAPANQQSVNAFNARFAFTSSGLDPSGDAFISRYEICDYGMARGNFAVSLAVFAAQARQFREMLATSPKTETDAGYSSDLAASALNRAALAVTADTEEAFHRASIDSGADRVAELIADETTPRNKIENVLER